MNMIKPENATGKLQPVFIHSSFRTGSTWLWSKFRQENNCYCYYEVFNEFLSDLDFKSIMQSSSTWNSHHPASAPYFSEFSPLLTQAGGVMNFSADMALDEFFLDVKGEQDRVFRETRYLTSLVDLAQNNGRIPVLTCTRSIGRIGLVKAAIGGTHILLKRRLLNQWFSYSNQAANNNSFFINTVIRTVNAHYGDAFISLLKKLLIDNDITEQNSGQNHEKILIVFLALHIYLYLKNSNNFDIVLALGRETSKSDMGVISDSIFKLTSLRLNLSDYNEVISAPKELIDDIDGVILIVKSLFAQGVDGVANDTLREYVELQVSEFKKDYEEYCLIAGSAHVQLKKTEADLRRSEVERSDAIAKLGAVAGSTAPQITELAARLEAACAEVEQGAERLRTAETKSEHARLTTALQQSERALEGLRIENERLASQIRDSSFQTERLREASIGLVRGLIAEAEAAVGEVGEHRIGDAVTPWRNESVVIFHDLRKQGATFELINLPAHPATDAYDRLHATRYYHWDTPEFIEFCQAIGLNPEEIRPGFADGHDALVQRLLERSSRYDDFKNHGPQGIDHYRKYIHDVLDLMRSDREPTAETFLRCCRDLVDWEEQPEAAEIRSFLLDFDHSRWSWVRSHPLDRRDQADPIPFPSQIDSNDQ